LTVLSKNILRGARGEGLEYLADRAEASLSFVFGSDPCIGHLLCHHAKDWLANLTFCGQMTTSRTPFAVLWICYNLLGRAGDKVQDSPVFEVLMDFWLRRIIIKVLSINVGIK